MHECIPYKVGKRVRFIEGLVRRMQCVQSVGAGVLDCPAVEPYRYYQAQANPSPGARAVREARPYERNGGRLIIAPTGCGVTAGD